MHHGWNRHEQRVFRDQRRVSRAGRAPVSGPPRTPASPADSPPPTAPRSRGSRATAHSRPSDQASPTVTSWPRRAQLLDDLRVRAGLHGHAAGAHAARVEGAGEAVVVPVRGVDGALEVEAAAYRRAQRDGEEEVQLPLVLLVAAGRAERHDRHAVAQGERGGEGGAGAAARGQGVRQALVQPGHLEPGAEREAQFGHDRVGLEPAAAGRGRDHVAPAVDDVEVAGVAAGGAVRRDVRLTRHGRRRPLRDRRLPAPGAPGASKPCSPAATTRACALSRGTRPPGLPGRSSYEAFSPTSARRPALYSSDSSSSEGHLGRVPVPGLPVGHGELAALDQQVDVLGGAVPRAARAAAGRAAGGGPGPGSRGRPCTGSSRSSRTWPGPRTSRGPGGEVGGRQRAGVPFAAGVHGGPGRPAVRAPRR